MRGFAIASIIVIIIVLTAGFLYQAQETNAESLDAIAAERKPAVEKNDLANKKRIEQNLTKSEGKVFENKDISDMAKQNIKAVNIFEDKEKSDYNEIPEFKALDLYNVNTRENIEVAFWVDGKFMPNGLDKLNQFMRDWRKDQVIEIDPDLYILLHELYNEFDVDAPIHLISGHRSKKTNDSLRAMGRNTAKKSQHVLGKAADISIPGVPVKKLRNEALEMKEGGVGFYPKSGFVHVDTGPVRQW